MSDDDLSELIEVDKQDESMNQNVGISKKTFTNPSQKIPMMECANALAPCPYLWRKSQLPSKTF